MCVRSALDLQDIGDGAHLTDGQFPLVNEVQLSQVHAPLATTAEDTTTYLRKYTNTYTRKN